jgi:hypothetical protein
MWSRSVACGSQHDLYLWIRVLGCSLVKRIRLWPHASPEGLVKRPGFMHASLRVCLGRVAGQAMVVLGLGLRWRTPAEAVHEPAGVVPADPL